MDKGEKEKGGGSAPCIASKLSTIWTVITTVHLHMLQWILHNYNINGVQLLSTWFNCGCQQRLHIIDDDSDKNNVSCIIAKADYSQYIFGSKHDVMLPASTLWTNAISHMT